ncbi:LuxR C-terminal-related transcriptional regulator [Mycobacterium sp. ITM-2016-00318]|uniref:LuxR C-terminal-related transcriptional regulator n=1 Tax=Mycobacterium sp. ITM-2016-00318 TaxID=2099693 RepID=UPI001E52DE44|nr:LuxR C-terminal-related transcriptional regulator [Mycobacterium sp. ITM-2016-00318]WNG93926.1 LuxR C-terminal-related transcriptional regulator [Mycobacterium sp. ITM-2016-00318]
MTVLSEGSATPSSSALADDNHPGWASRPARETDAHRRYREAFADSGAVPSDDPMAVVADAVDAKITVVRNALETLGNEDALNALESMLDLSSLERELIEDGARRRTFALLQVQEGLSKLRAVDDVAMIVDRAPRELVQSCGFDRAVLFRVHEGRMVMESAYFGEDRDGAEKMVHFAQSVAPPLDHMLLETEMIRRRAPAIVRDARNDARVNRPIVDFSMTHSYVAAPVMPTGKVIGFLHADRLYSGRKVDDIDRDTVWAFAEGFGYAYERTVLQERMRRQHAEVRRALASADAAARALQDADLNLRKIEPVERSPAARSLAEVQTRVMAMLTRREIEVLRLMAAGRTNQQIADELVISAGTVKSHVKRVLRKLHATNRAEAASAYVRLAATPGAG